MMKKDIQILLMLMIAALSSVVRAEMIPVGLEHKITVTMPSGIIVAPIQQQSDVVIRILKCTSIGGEMSRYDLGCTLMRAGRHDLKRYLLRHDGTPADFPDDVTVVASSLLPSDYQGGLMAGALPKIPARNYYWQWAAWLGVFWALALALITLVRRKRVNFLKADCVIVVPEATTIQQKIRGLASQVQIGLPLSVEQQAHLETLLICYWRQKRNLEQCDIATAMAGLRSDPEAGALIEQLENWLHRPGVGRQQTDTRDMLKRYASCED